MGNDTEYIKKLEQQVLELNSKLEAAESLKSHFISNITNEIVNPFASILGLSTQILETDQISFDQMKYLASLIHTETFHLDFQLRNIFAAAKIEAGQIFPEARVVNVHEMLNELIELFALEAGKKNIEISIDFSDDISESFTWVTDVVRLKLVLINFMHNAVKFTHDDTCINVSVCTDSDKLVLKIKDEGIGISDEGISEIFNRFTTVKAGINTAYRGNGLGLSINKALVDILGGDIQIDNKTEQGVIFIVSLPQLHNLDEEMGAGTDFLFDDELIF